jgi:branched-chain amino acid transport system ATP-binding protein
MLFLKRKMAESMAVLSLKNVRKNFGETEIIRGVDLDIDQGEKHAIIGPNGAGKSTLFHLISGLYSVTDGTIEFNDAEIQNKSPFEISRLGLARSFQVTNIFARMNVFENVRCALLWSTGYRYSFWHLLGRQTELNEKAAQVLEQIGLKDKMHYPAGELAYAQQRALELGIAIASGAEVIMLDEPVAGMSHSEAENAVELIRRITEGKTLIMVEHDMNIVFDVADRISVLVYGEIIACDKPENIRTNPRVQEAYLGEVAANA